MKKKLTAEAWAALPEALQALYTADGDNYTIKPEFAAHAADDPGDEDDTGALKRAKQHEKDRRKEAETKLREANERLAAIDGKTEADRLKAIREAGDTDALEKSYKAKLKAEQDARAADNARLQGALESATCGQEAARIAAEVSTVPELMEPEIRRRLKAEISEDGRVIVRVLDAAGQPSADSLADLKKEIASQDRWKAIIKGHSASGGGASDGGSSEGGSFKLASYLRQDKTVNWTKVAEAEAKEPGVLEKVQAALAETE